MNNGESPETQPISAELAPSEYFSLENPVNKKEIKVCRFADYHGDLQGLLKLLGIDKNGVLDIGATTKILPYSSDYVDRSGEINRAATSIQGQIIDHNVGRAKDHVDYFHKWADFEGFVIARSKDRIYIWKPTLGHTGPAFTTEEISLDGIIDGDISIPLSQ